eukprot:SAG25_NODE_7824_length_456_cov_0.820728_1_plen_93_part_10
MIHDPPPPDSQSQRPIAAAARQQRCWLALAAWPFVAMVAVRRAPTTSPLGHILSVLDEDGGLVVEGMFDPEHISALRRAVLGRAFGYGAARDA